MAENYFTVNTGKPLSNLYNLKARMAINDYFDVP